jgi:hypothetical protein
MPNRAAREAGVQRDPSASVPKERGLYPADKPTAEPEEEPPGAWSLVSAKVHNVLFTRTE